MDHHQQQQQQQQQQYQHQHQHQHPQQQQQQQQQQDNASVALAVVTTIGWYIVYPIGKLLGYCASLLLLIWKLLYTPVAWLLQPFVYLGRFTLACLAWPFTMAAKLETIYIYLGVAVIVGLSGGLIVRSVYAALRSLLRLDSQPAMPRVRTVKQYREQKRKQMEKTEMPVPFPPQPASTRPTSPSTYSASDSSRRRRKNLLAQTILEEDDSDF